MSNGDPRLRSRLLELLEYEISPKDSNLKAKILQILEEEEEEEEEVEEEEVA